MSARILLDRPTDDAAVRDILLRTGTIAVVGASPNPLRPSHGVMRYLLGEGYRVIPINPGHAGREILGQPVAARLADVIEPIDMVDIFRRAEAISPLMDEILALQPPPRTVWMQLGIVNESAAAAAATVGIDVVMDRCPAIDHPRLVGRVRAFGWACGGQGFPQSGDRLE